MKQQPSTNKKTAKTKGTGAKKSTAAAAASKAAGVQPFKPPGPDASKVLAREERAQKRNLKKVEAAPPLKKALNAK